MKVQTLMPLGLTTTLLKEFNNCCERTKSRWMIVMKRCGIIEISLKLQGKKI